MRNIFLLVLCYACLVARPPIACGQSAAQMKQTIIYLEKQLANAKKNPAMAGQVKSLTAQLETVRLALESEERAASQAATPMEAGPKWTGYIRAEKKYSADFPVTTRDVHIELNFTEAIPTLHREFNVNDELNFTDDKGTGSVREHAVITLANQTYTCDCSGNGASELHEVVVNLIDSNYSIQAFAPLCQGGTSSDGSCGLSWDISVSDQPLTNSKVLSGTMTEKNTIGNITGSMTATWYLVRTVDAELIVTPEDYDNWMPEPGEDENTVGSQMKINLQLQGKNGKPLTHKAARFELQLMQTSREPGITINFPKNPQGNLPDIRFLKQANATVEDEFQKIKLKCDRCTSSSVAIGAYDGGGWSTLVAVAVLEDSSRVIGHLLNATGPMETLLPKRNSGSVIAVKWADRYNNPADTDDKDSSRGNTNTGDGFSAYEEYRGVMSEGTYTRLDPKKKELAVRVKASELPNFSEGLNWFKNASGIDVLRFYMYEVAANRRINFNSNNAHIYDQFALKLDKGSLANNQAGKAFTTSNHADLPANTTQVVIALNNIHQNYLNWSQWAAANNLQLLWTEQEYIAQTVAHEIGHGVNVWHHGDGNGLPHPTAKKDTPPIYHIFDRGSSEITTRDFTVAADDRICDQGTQTSGDLSCVMAYVDVCDWVQINYGDGSIGLFQSPLLPIGNKFCTSKTGTSINRGTHNVSGVAYDNYFGKATNGECLGHIKLK